MNEITLLRDVGPAATPLTATALRTARAALLQEIEAAAPARTAQPEPASVLAARQLVDDARGRQGATVVGRRRPTRRGALRAGGAVLVAAAAVTAAVLVAEPEAAAPPSDQVAQADRIRLVDFDLPTQSLTLPTPPPGTAAPTLGADSAGGTSMTYTSTESPFDFLSITVGTEPGSPDGPVSFPGSVPEDITVNGSPAVIVAPTQDEAIAGLNWERRSGQWVTIFAQGRYAQRDLLTGIAADLVDDPQGIPVQLHLAPAGYSLDFFKDDGRIVRLADDTDPSLGLTVQLLSADEVTSIEEQLPSVGSRQDGTVEDVTVQGQPAQLARTDHGDGGEHGWVLQALLPGGRTFVVEAPGGLTSEQVVQIADQVTYTP
ncbi:hypothetical protein [Modestobacter sp. VKM Ac-2984]|uniref:hypothetical protein n=1 Tax=Modestobacter sp. VKM Ac-2984 TaxID=3004138 RepID=UPI0022AAA4F7|nr:hypothetical protein [Modestobacter sp. VKM Ac-2984]MCZ2815339.1 hypothetical protein [Modestobacter sp. VKM Ac-2984]